MAPLRPIGDLATLADVLDVTEEAAANLVLNAAVQEQATPEAQAAQASLTLTPSVIEQVAGTETAQAGIALSPNVVEQAGAADAVSASLSLTPNVTEVAAGAGSEQAAATLTLTPNVTGESLGAEDAPSASLSLTPNVIEEAGAAATETAVAGLTLTPDISSEALGALDTAASSLGLSPAVVESATETSQLPDGVVTLYDYEDDTDTTTATDIVGSNNATISGAAFSTSDPAKGSVSLDLDGTDDIGTSQNGVDIASDGTPGEFTVGAWVKTQTTPDPSDFAFNWYESGGNECGLLYGEGNGGYIIWLNTSNSGSINDVIHSPTFGTWYHYAAVVTSSTMELYVDGSSVGTASHSENIGAIGAGDIIHGDRGPSQGQNPNVVLDDLFVATSALSSSEVSEVMNR